MKNEPIMFFFIVTLRLFPDRILFKYEFINYVSTHGVAIIPRKGIVTHFEFYL